MLGDRRGLSQPWPPYWPQPKNQMRIRKKSEPIVKTQLLSISSHVFQQDVKNLFRLLLV